MQAMQSTRVCTCSTQFLNSGSLCSEFFEIWGIEIVLLTSTDFEPQLLLRAGRLAEAGVPALDCVKGCAQNILATSFFVPTSMLLQFGRIYSRLFHYGRTAVASLHCGIASDGMLVRNTSPAYSVGAKTCECLHIFALQRYL